MGSLMDSNKFLESKQLMTKVTFIKYMGVRGWQAYLQLVGFHSLFVLLISMVEIRRKSTEHGS